MRRISCFFEYTDSKSVEAKTWASLAKDRVRGECALLGVAAPAIKIDRSAKPASVNGQCQLFRGEAFALIPDESVQPSDFSIRSL